MTETYDILISIAGTPQTDMQANIAYLGGVAITVILFFSVVYVFKVISQVFKRD